MKRLFQVFVVILTVSVVAIGAFIESQTPMLRLSEEQVQEKVSGLFPITGKKMIFEYEFTNPEVNFLPDGLVSLASDINMQTAHKSVKGQVKLQAKPIYVAGSGEIYLQDLAVKRLQWEKEQIKNPEETLLNSIKKKLSDALPDVQPYIDQVTPTFKEELKSRVNRYLEKTPVYTLDDNNRFQRMLKLRITRIRFDEGDLLVKLSWATHERRLFFYFGVVLALSLLVHLAFFAGRKLEAE